MTETKRLINSINQAPPLWIKYKNFVKTATKNTSKKKERNVIYWREQLYTNFITYLFPVCFIALVPGVLLGIEDGHFFISLFDLFVVGAIALISLNKKINFSLRKAGVFFILYSLAIVLMANLGAMGPGILYLLFIVILITLTFPANTAYWSITINFAVCAGFAVVIYFKLFNIPYIHEYTLAVWVAVSSNLIFLSWMSVLLINYIIQSLEKTIIKDFKLKNELQKESLISARNDKLLKESESHYKSLFFLNPSPMWVFDSKSLRFLQVNEAAIKSYGYSNDEFLAMTLHDIKLEKDIEILHNDLRKNLKTGIPVRLTTIHLRKNQEQFYAEVVFNAILFRGKKAILTIAQDISEQIKHIQAIESQNEKLREIAYVHSHLVRAPLASILGLIALVTDNVVAKDDQELLLHLNESAKDLDNIIHTITNNAQIIPVKNWN